MVELHQLIQLRKIILKAFTIEYIIMGSYPHNYSIKLELGYRASNVDKQHLELIYKFLFIYKLI